MAEMVPGTRKGYHTKQKAQVLSYLERIPGKHVTALQVYDELKAGGSRIGSATVYRTLEHLVDEGIVKKYHIDAGSPACFEYVGEQAISSEQAAGMVNCFHCKCEKCGRLIHLQCEEVESFFRHLQSEHEFKIDPLRTVFYGVCKECRDQETDPGEGNRTVRKIRIVSSEQWEI